MEQTAVEAEPTRSDTGASESPRIQGLLSATRDNWQIVALIVILIIAFTLRFWDLGTRVLHHDESIHAVQSWRIYMGYGYRHDPVYHGMFLYLFNALIYFLFGASDYTARIGPALAGMVLVFLPWLLRDRLTKAGALTASLLLAVSPSVLYYSRSLRHDIYAATGTMLLAVAMWRYLDERRPRWLFVAVLGLALGFTNHELTYISVFIFAIFLLFTEGGNLLATVRKRSPAFLSPGGEFLLLLGTICAPLFTAAILIPKRLTDPLVTALGTNAVLGATFFILAGLSVALGVWWKGKLWFSIAAVFWGIFGLIYTGFLGDPPGFFSGAIGALQYWITQQGYRRGAQPWYYYVLLLPLYDFLPLFFGAIAVVYHMVRRSFFGWFLFYWSLASFLLYSWAGEKMPWLVIHISIPVILLASSFLGPLIAETDWRSLWRRRGYDLLIFSVLIFSGVFGLLLLYGGYRPLRPTEASYLQLELLVLVAVLLIGVVGLIYRAIVVGLLNAAKLGLAAILVILFATTLRTSLQANFKNTDTPVEMLIYTQSSPDVRSVMQELDAVAFRAGTGKNLKVAYDSSVSWPFEWYLRDWPGRIFFGQGSPPQDAAVILVGFDDDHDGRIRSQLGDRYVGQRYKLRWWFPEDYKSADEWVRALNSDQSGQQLLPPSSKPLGFSDVIAASLSPTGFTKLVRYFLFRETLSPLGSTDFMLYVRKDLASGGGQATTTVTPPASNGYAAKTMLLNATQIIAGPGNNANLLGQPEGVAVGPDRSIYVADAQTKSIQKYSPAGVLLTQWGTPGDGDGQFQQDWGPWGIAVDKEGNVYVADMWNHRIQKFDPDGKFLLKWGEQGTGPGQFFGPRGIAVDGAGNVYVADTGNHRVQVFDGQGHFLLQAGTKGSGDGQFSEPVGIAVDQDGYVYVADTWNQRIQKLDRSLKPVATFPVQGWTSDSPTNKPYLTVDNRGFLYATDPDNQRVLKFTTAGSVVGTWGRAGTDAGSFQFPSGVAADADGSVLVADTVNHRILRFSSPG